MLVEWKLNFPLIVCTPHQLSDLALPAREAVKGKTACVCNRIAARGGIHTPVASQVFTLIKGLQGWRQQRWHVSYTLMIPFVTPCPAISVVHLQFLSTETFGTSTENPLIFLSNMMKKKIMRHARNIIMRRRENALICVWWNKSNKVQVLMLNCFCLAYTLIQQYFQYLYGYIGVLRTSPWGF